MPVILVTGMSGTGKSTTLAALARLGYVAIDTDYGDWTTPGPDPLWREDLIDALITTHEHSGDPLFISGTVRNQAVFRPRFDHIVLLTAPLAVILDRVTHRTTNPYGNSPADRTRITTDTTLIEPLLRQSATVEIDTRRPLPEVIAHLTTLAGPLTANPPPTT
ncbi:AAA family ATPase [Actinokineospora inagensis]|uniref:AAA family ATPase n=1 Tax=Actinokineospora inagensis TaxID=103730 RepID=UPI00047DA621|nr:AAA family ATPase [Actinokineospora inagensis]